MGETKMNYNYLEEACQLNDELVAYRRYLHANPELGLSLPGTKAYVMKTLSDFGYQPLEYGESGVAVLAGGKKPGKVFLIRADMDALPIEEESGVPYASRIKGRMHTCGHDNHTAMLLGAAKLLKRHEDEIEGTVKILFQPGEETLEGAKAMIEAGILENPHVDAALMFHDIAGSPVKEGTVGVFGPGAVYASSGRFEIHIKGVGGHGAAPDWTHNPLGAMCAIYQGIHEIVAEHRSPFDSCTMTVGKMSAGDIANIIPETAIMQGTIRTFSKQVGERLRKDLVTLVEYVGKAKGVTAEVTFGTACPPLVVDSNVHKSFLCSMKEMFGDEAWDMRTAWGGAYSKSTSAEDFSYIAEKVPSGFGWIFLGDSRQGRKWGCHNPKVQFNDAYLYRGAAAYTKAAMDWLLENAAAGTVSDCIRQAEETLYEMAGN